MTPRVLILNDHVTTIPGSRTFWHDILDWTQGTFLGGDYRTLAQEAFALLEREPFDLVIRNATYFTQLRHKIPTISFLQDIITEGPLRHMQEQVIASSTLTIFNSAYTVSHYPSGIPHRIIPIGTDADFWTLPPEGTPKEYDVCWIGAMTEIKGWDILDSIVQAMPDTRFAVILKDKDAARSWFQPNLTLFCRLPREGVRDTIWRSRIGLCTSRMESQHLAGIEMGMSGLPLATTNVGVYWDGSDRHGRSVDDWVNLIRFTLDEPETPQAHRNYWLSEGFDRETCRRKWMEVVKEVAG